MFECVASVIFRIKKVKIFHLEYSVEHNGDSLIPVYLSHETESVKSLKNVPFKINSLSEVNGATALTTGGIATIVSIAKVRFLRDGVAVAKSKRFQLITKYR